MAREETIRVLIDKSKTVAPLQELKNEAKALQAAFGSIQIAQATQQLNAQSQAATAAARAAQANANAQAAQARATAAAVNIQTAQARAAQAQANAQNAQNRAAQSAIGIIAAQANAANAAARAQAAQTNAQTANIRQQQAQANATAANVRVQQEQVNLMTAWARLQNTLNAGHNRAATALQRMGQAIGAVNTNQAQAVQFMTQWIRQQNGLNSAQVQATGAIHNAAGEFQTYRASVSEAGGATHNYRMAVNTATGEVYQLDQGIRTTAVSLRDMSSILRAVRTVVGFTGIAQSMRSAFAEMKSMSDAMAEYRKVTGATSQEMETLRGTAYEVAKSYGESASGVIASAANMARAGYKENSLAMAELATKTKLVGDMTQEAADKFLIAVDAAYKYQGNVEELSAILDAANEIDNNYATTISHIAEGTTLVASLAATAKVPIEQMIAALGTMQATTQRSGSEIARGYRYILLHAMGDTETEIEEGVTATEEAVQTLTDAVMKYGDQSVKSAVQAGKLINPMEKIVALQKAYKEGALTDEALYEIGSKVAGQRYYNVFSALITNPEMYNDMLQSISQSMGSAQNEIDILMDSWSKKLEQLNTTWTQVVNNTVSENFIKGLIDGGRQALEFAGNLENLAIMAGGALAAVRALGTGLSNLSQNTRFGGFNIGMGLFGLGVTAIGVWKAAYENAIREVQQKAAQTAKEAISEITKTENIEEIQKAYETIMEDGLQAEQGEIEKLKTLQDQLNGLVGDQGTAVDLVNGKYGEQKKALKGVLEQQIENAKQAALIAKTEAMRAFRETDLNGWMEWGTNAEGFSKTSVPMPAAHITDDDAETIRNLVADSYYLGVVSGEKFGAFLGIKKPDTFEEAVEFTKEIKDLYTYIASSGIGDRNPTFFAALSKLWESVENAGGEAGSILEISDAIEEYDRQLEALEEQENSAAESIKESTNAMEGQKTAAVELTDAIDEATKAKEAFDEAMKNSKADAMNDYTKAFETLKEEIDAGRVNSTAFYASARMLMGDAAYNATGGNSLEVMAALNQRGASGSLLEARDILNQKYYYDGQEIQGYGIWELLSRTKGFDQRSLYDANGMMMVPELTQEQIQQISASWGNLSENLIVSWLNALDQYDKSGQATDKNVEAQKTAEEQLGEESTTAADSVKTLGENAEEAAARLKEIADESNAGEEELSLSDIDTNGIEQAIEGAVASGLDKGAASAGKQADKLSEEAEDTTESLLNQYNDAADFLSSLVDAIVETNGNIDEAMAALGASWEDIAAALQATGYTAAVDTESAQETLNKFVQQYTGIELKFNLSANPDKAVSTADDAVRAINRKKATIQIGAQYTGGIIGNLIAGFIGGTRFANGTESHQGGPAFVNDGTGPNAGPELIVEKGRAFIAGGGEPAIVNLNKGAKVFTASETRDILSRSGIPSYAKGIDTSNMDAVGGSQSNGNALSGALSWIQSFLGFDKNKITTAPPTNGDGKTTGSGTNGGGSSSPKIDEKAFENLSAMVDYIVKRIGEALDEQLDIIDKQIDALKQQKDALDAQNELEEKQKAVAEAQRDLETALSERTIRYLGEDGKWHWMADARNVQTAQENLQKAQDALSEYQRNAAYNAEVAALEAQKKALQEEYTNITDAWSKIQAGVETPTGDLAELISAVLTGGTPQQQTGVNAIRDYLIGSLLTGGSYAGNYSEALDSIAKATAGSPVMPDGSGASLAALIATGGGLTGSTAEALRVMNGGVTGSVTGAFGDGGTHINYNYFVNGMEIGAEAAQGMTLSEVMRSLTVYAGQ